MLSADGFEQGQKAADSQESAAFYVRCWLAAVKVNAYICRTVVSVNATACYPLTFT